MISALGSRAKRAPGIKIFDRRTPDPITATSMPRTRSSTSTGQLSGSPIGVIPPYSIPVRSTALSIGRNEALRTSRRRRTTPLMSARVVASTTQAASRSVPSRLPPTTTQLARASGGKPNSRCVVAVSETAGSISTTPTSSRRPKSVRARHVGGASRSGRAAAGTLSRSPSLSSAIKGFAFRT